MALPLDTFRKAAIAAVFICVLLLGISASSAVAQHKHGAHHGHKHHGHKHHAHKHHARHRVNACHRWGKKNPARLSKPQASKAIACYLNRARARHNLHSLKITQSLNRASQGHTEYMQRHRCFDHECPGEAALDSRLRKARYLKGGLRAWSYGENIAWGQDHLGTPKAMVKAWMHSAGHRANILNPQFRDLGIGFRDGSPSKRSDDAGLYTTDFGYRKG